MCGIFGFASLAQKSSSMVLNGLKRLEYRGYDSWGIVVEKNGKLLIDKHIGKIGQAKTNLPSSTIGLGHTRWATHGGVTQANAHPHLDCTRSLALVHNGIIENYDTLKKRLTGRHKFASQTDTEVAVHMIEDLKKTNSFVSAVRKAFVQFEGLNAIIAIDSLDKTLVLAKTGSPLILGFGKGENFIASDSACLLEHTRQVYFIDDGQMAVIKADKVQVLELKSGKPINFKKQTIDWTLEETQKGKFDHFMLKEIYEQPRIIRNIAANNHRQINALSQLIKKSVGTYLVACGSAAYAAICATYLFSKIAKRHLNFSYGSEFGYTLDFINSQSLVIALSQSGETIDIIDSVKKAKKRGAKIAALVNVLGSSLYRLADFKVLLTAGPEKAVASTKAFIAKIANLLMLAYAFTKYPADGRDLLDKSADEVDRLLMPENIQKIKKLADLVAAKSDIYAIGRGISYPIALEATLKIKEVSYIHAEGFAAGELKHGFIALVEKGTPCIVFLPNDETYGATMAGAMEVKARGGFIIGISAKNHEVFDYFIPVSDCAEATVIPNTVVSQLLAYFLSVKKGIDPDKPRNLAKSVTVK